MPQQDRLLRRYVLLAVLVLVGRRLPFVVEVDEPRELPGVPHVSNGERTEHGDDDPNYTCHKVPASWYRFTMFNLNVIFVHDDRRFRGIE